MISILSLLLGLQISYAATIDEVCETDPQFCSRSISYDKKVIKPSDEIIALAKSVAPFVKEVSARYQVPPEAIIGSIMAENTMNVNGLRSGVKNFLMATGLNNAYKAMTGHTPSLGLGSIHVETAREVEAEVAKIEKRPPRTDEQIGMALGNPSESIIYAAAIIKRGEKIYKDKGMDISGNTPLLATLYNLGKVEDRANKAATEKREPRINYFGFFVQENMKIIHETAETTAEEEPSTPGKFAFAFKERTPMLPYPPNCGYEQESFDGNEYGLVKKYKRTLSLNIPNSTAQAEGQVGVLAQNLDCEMKPWSLIKTKKGEIGWVSQEQLDKAGKSPLEADSCKPQDNQECKEALQKAIGQKFVLDKNKNGLTEIRLAAKDDSKEFDIAQWNPECLKGSVTATNAPAQQGRYVPPWVMNPYGMPGMAGIGYGYAQPMGYSNGYYGSYGASSYSSNPTGSNSNACAQGLVQSPYGCAPAANQMIEVDAGAMREIEGKVAEKKEQLMSAFHVKSERQLPSHVQMALMQFDSLRTSDCKAFSCQMDSKRFADFINMDAKVFSESYVKGYQKATESLNIVMVTAKPPEMKASLKILDDIGVRCKSYFAREPADATQFENVRKETLANAEKISQLSYPSPDELLRKCDFLADEVYNEPSDTPAKTEAVVKAGECKECAKGAHNGFNYMGSTIYASMLHDKEDQQSFIGGEMSAALGFFANINNDLQNSKPRGKNFVEYDNPSCRYDPLATMERVKKSLDVSCVEAIVVPDQFVVKTLTVEGHKRVIFGNASKGDRFALKMKGDCIATE